MKIIIQNNSIAGTATDAYTGPDAFIDAPADFDEAHLADYVVTDGVLTRPIRVPSSVTMRQARLALLGAGHLAAVNAAIAAMPEPQKTAALIEWEYSNEVWRNKGFVVALGGILGLTDEQLDALFIAASKL